MTEDIMAIHDDPNFVTLACWKTNAEEFMKLVDEHCPTYSMRERVVDGLKTSMQKIEEVEGKLYVAKAVGKSKGGLSPEDQVLSDLYQSSDIKQKTQALKTAMDMQIDEGRITSAEKPHVVESMRARINKAKEANKAHVVEKLDKRLTACIKAASFVAPIADIAKIYSTQDILTKIQKIRNRNQKTWTQDDRDALDKMDDLNQTYATLRKKNTMWFESTFEFEERLGTALRVYEMQAKERLRKEEEDAFQRQLVAEVAERERKQQEADEKEKREHAEMMKRIEARRLEAKALPGRSLPKAQPKKKAIQLDVRSLGFHDVLVEELEEAARAAEAAAEAAAEEAAVAEVDAKQQAVEEKTSSVSANALQAAKEEKAAAAKEAAEKASDAKKKVKAVRESMWGTVADSLAEGAAEDKDNEELPSLAASAKQAATRKTPDEKQAALIKAAKEATTTSGSKKTNRGWKMDPRELGFQGSLAKEVEAATARAVAAEAAASAARAEADVVEVDRATAAAKAASAAVQAKKAADAAAVAAKTAQAVAKKKEKVVIESKWGAPASIPGDLNVCAGSDDDGEGEDMPSLAAAAKTLNTKKGTEAKRGDQQAPKTKAKKTKPVKLGFADLGFQDALAAEVAGAAERAAAKEAAELAAAELAVAEAAAAAEAKTAEAVARKVADDAARQAEALEISSTPTTDNTTKDFAPKPRPPPKVIESKWGMAPNASSGTEEAENEAAPADGKAEGAEALPSLADVMKVASAKKSQLQPKKKAEKKKPVKMTGDLLGFQGAQTVG